MRILIVFILLLATGKLWAQDQITSKKGKTYNVEIVDVYDKYLIVKRPDSSYMPSRVDEENIQKIYTTRPNLFKKHPVYSSRLTQNPESGAVNFPLGKPIDKNLIEGIRPKNIRAELRRAGNCYLWGDILLVGGGLLTGGLAFSKNMDVRTASYYAGGALGLTAISLRFAGHIHLLHAGSYASQGATLGLSPTPNGIGLVMQF